MCLCFKLRNGKSIRQRRENEYVGVSVKLTCLLASRRAKPFHTRSLSDCAGVRDFHRTNQPKFNGLITQYSSRLEQPRNAFAQIHLTEEKHPHWSLLGETCWIAS